LRNKYLLLLSCLLASVAIITCGCKKPAPAQLLPSNTQTMFEISSIRDVWLGMPGSIEEALTEVAETMGNSLGSEDFNPKEIGGKVVDFLGFDPLSLESYENAGVDLDRPFAVAITDLNLLKGVRVAVLIPTRNTSNFDAFIKTTLKKVAADTGENFKPDFIEEDKINSMKLGEKSVFSWVHHKGYTIAAVKKDTLDMLTNGDFEPLSKSDAFVKTMQPVGEGFTARWYMAPDLLLLGKSAIATAAKLPGTYMDKWVGSERGMAFGMFAEPDSIKSAFYLPVSENGYFEKILDGSDDVSGILKNMPPDPAVVTKQLIDFKIIFEILDETMVFFPDARLKFDEILEEMEKQLQLDVENDLVAHLENGVVLVEYFRKTEQPMDIGKGMGMFFGVHTDASPEASKNFKKMLETISNLAATNDIQREDFKDGSVLYSAEMSDEVKISLHWGYVNGWLVFSNWKNLALAPDAATPALSPNLLDTVNAMEVGPMVTDPARHVMIADMAKAAPFYESMAGMDAPDPAMGNMMKGLAQIMRSFEPSYAEWGVSGGNLWFKSVQKGGIAQINNLMTAYMGMFTAIALPNFLKFKSKAVQSEAKANLSAIWTASTAYYAEHNKYPGTFESASWKPEGETRYSYYLKSCEQVIPSSETGYAGCPSLLKEWLDTCDKNSQGTGPCAAAVGNIDSDDTLDIWVIDKNKIPTNLVDDIMF